MSNSAHQIFSERYFLTAGECDAEGRMPLTLLVARIIETATNHANSLGIGYARLIEMDLAWVLSRVSIEIENLPGINDTYVMNTWIESTNRLFSERCFSITDSEGKVYASARTTWAAICITTRQAANPGVLGDVMFPSNPPVCEVKAAKKTQPLPDYAECSNYTFRYCDVDFNRHVNTVRYVELLLNHWGLDWYDTHKIARFDIAFHHECHFGETVAVRVVTDDSLVSACELALGDKRMVSSNIVWH
ncbi:MAG: hypothetical protein K2K94_00130, partial [Muribaculaceae bacterium]|nr:hypothetical protein [Muribaculaceae bacterium]